MTDSYDSGPTTLRCVVIGFAKAAAWFALVFFAYVVVDSALG